MESNHRPPPYQGGALPTELRERVLQPSSLTAKNRPASCRTSQQKRALPWRLVKTRHPAGPSTLAVNGAGDGNRTRASSLEGYSSTIELLPHFPGFATVSRDFQALHRDLLVGGGRWIRTTEGVSQQIYSLPPLAAWVSLQLHSRAGLGDCRSGFPTARDRKRFPSERAAHCPFTVPTVSRLRQHKNAPRPPVVSRRTYFSPGNG